MSDQLHHEFSLDNLIKLLKLINVEVNKLVNNNNEKNSFQNDRNLYLHQFSVLSGCLHYQNTANFLKDTDRIASLFAEEIKISEHRIDFFQEQAIDQIFTYINDFNVISSNLYNFENQIYEIINNLINNKNDLGKILSDNDILRSNNVEFDHSSFIKFLEDLLESVIHPINNIIEKEINAGSKILELVNNYTEENLDRMYNLEEIARMCELLSMGLEGIPDMDSIKEYFNELYPKITQNVNLLNTINYLFEIEKE